MNNPYIEHLGAMQEIYERDIFLRRDSRKTLEEQRPHRDEKYADVDDFEQDEDGGEE